VAMVMMSWSGATMPQCHNSQLVRNVKKKKKIQRGEKREEKRRDM